MGLCLEGQPKAVSLSHRVSRMTSASAAQRRRVASDFYRCSTRLPVVMLLTSSLVGGHMAAESIPPHRVPAHPPTRPNQEQVCVFSRP